MSWLFGMQVNAQTVRVPLDKASFGSHWTLEHEAAGDTVGVQHGVCSIMAEKGGFTLWYNEPIEGDVVIEYDAQIYKKGKKGRLSDLNCFWMATDPKVAGGSVFERMAERNGTFGKCYSLQMYYLGYGGNYNSTTRFRRYDGVAGTGNHDKPAILKEYTDAPHLLKANHWYHIRIVCQGGRVTYSIDGGTIVEYLDAKPLKRGWFGLRTTQAIMKVKNFKLEVMSVF